MREEIRAARVIMMFGVGGGVVGLGMMGLALATNLATGAAIVISLMLLAGARILVQSFVHFQQRGNNQESSRPTADYVLGIALAGGLSGVALLGTIELIQEEVDAVAVILIVGSVILALALFIWGGKGIAGRISQGQASND